MWRRIITDQQGSLAPVAISLFLCVALLIAFVLDREWVNYRLRLIEQTADFAAEAGAQYFDVHYTVQVTRRQLYEESYWVCDEYEYLPELGYRCRPDAWREVFVTRARYDTRRIAGTKERLERDWKQMAGCDRNPWTPNWQCWHWEIENPTGNLVFHEEAARTATAVFKANLPTHASVAIDGEPDVTFNTSERDVRVSVIADLGSLFGWGRNRTAVTGRAVSQYELLRLEM